MIYNKYLSFNFLYLFIVSIFGHLFFEVESFTPFERIAHSSVLVGDKIYFFGGANTVNLATFEEVFYLDVSQQFNVSNPPWVDLTTTIPAAKIPYGSAWATAVVGDITKDPVIYLFGGITRDMNNFEDSFSSVLHSFNLNTTKWNKPDVKGKEPDRRREIKSVIDKTGKIYYLGGALDQTLNSTTTRLFNEMVILNTVDSTWSYGSVINLPNTRIDYTATLLSNGIIVYIGGRGPSANITVDIGKINLYNTNSSTWSEKTANFKDSIESRYSHTAVLTSDGKIIIYGGAKVVLGINTIRNARPTPDLAVLNTNTEPFEWTAPQVSSNVGTVPSLMVHTADLVGNYMIVAFGNITQTNAAPLKLNPNIYVMDIRSYTWVDTFDNSDNKLTTAKIIIITVSAIVGTAVLIGLGFLVHKSRKMKKMTRESDVLTITGSTVEKYNEDITNPYNQGSEGTTTVTNSPYNQATFTANNSPYTQGTTTLHNSLYNHGSEGVKNSPYNQGITTENNSLYSQGTTTIHNSLYNHGSEGTTTTVNNSPYNSYNPYNQGVIDSSNCSSTNV